MTWSGQTRYRARAAQAFPGAEASAAATAVGGAPGGSTGGARQGSSPVPNTGTSDTEGRQTAGAAADDEVAGAAVSRATITIMGDWDDLSVQVEFDPPVMADQPMAAPHEVAHGIVRWLQQTVGELVSAKVDGEPLDL